MPFQPSQAFAYTPPIPLTVSPRVADHVLNATLANPAGHEIADIFRTCANEDAEMTTTLIVCLVLSIIQSGLQLVWYKRWNAKQDKGKKGINMWLTLIPLIASVFPFSGYKNRSGFMCRPHTTACERAFHVDGSGRAPKACIAQSRLLTSLRKRRTRSPNLQYSGKGHT